MTLRLPHRLSERIGTLPAPSKGLPKARTSATCLLVRERELYIAWVGGSHAVLSSDGKAVCLTGQGEYDQSDTLGAPVSDSESKSNSNSNQGDLPSVVAHTLSHSIKQDDEFIVLASKGLWAVMEKQKAVELVSEFLSVFGDSRAASEELMDEALRKYKSDVSVVIVWFKDIAN